MTDDELENTSPLDAVPDRVVDGTNHGISLMDAKRAFQKAEADERAKYQGDPVYWDDNANIANETFTALKPIEDAWMAGVRDRYGVENLDEVQQRAEWDDQLKADLELATGQYSALADGYAQIKQRAEDDAFNKLRPGDTATRQELREEALSYLRNQGLNDEQIAYLWNSGALRRATNQVRLHDIVKGEAERKKELKKLDGKFASGNMSLREAARRLQLRGK